jgi:hypothetical protein
MKVMRSPRIRVHVLFSEFPRRFEVGGLFTFASPSQKMRLPFGGKILSPITIIAYILRCYRDRQLKSKRKWREERNICRKRDF